jgi:hypothetical protein
MRANLRHRSVYRGAIAAAALCASVHFQTAQAQGFFVGPWKIEKSEPAPWVKSPEEIEKQEVKRLVGARVEMHYDRIDGPAPLHCTHPRYSVKSVPAEGLFEGGLAEMGDASTTADKLADSIGFHNLPAITLMPNCESEIEYHAIDDNHLVFALNNSLYRLIRVSAAPAKSKP